MEKLYTHTDIKWVKNVKREDGKNWAYEDQEIKSVFELNWSEHFGKNVSRPNPGDIILLFQTIKGGLGHPKGTYLTHLVTPIDKEVYYDKTSTHPNIRLVRVIANQLISSSGNNFNLSKVSRGICYDIALVGSKKRTIKRNIVMNQQVIWNVFENKIIEKLELIDSNDDDGVWEGGEKQKMKMHRYYERNLEIIAKAKNMASSLKCEVCTFSFGERYPILGNGSIECHHKIPIGTGIKRCTTVKDLALVCSNCHRMLHKKHKGQYLSVEKLKELIVQTNR